MSPAKTQRRKGAKEEHCHFERREKSFLDPSRSLGMTGLGPSTWRLCVFAGELPKFLRAAEGGEGMTEKIVSLHAGYNAKGGVIHGFLARPAVSERRPAIVLLSAMWGLNWTQRELTRDFARAGFVALSPDLLHGQLPKDRVTALLAKTSLDVDQTVDDIVAACRYLRKLPWVGAQGKLGVGGFCLGGGLALLALARTREFQAGVIHHHSVFPDPEELRGITCKILGHYEMEEEGTPREEG